MIATGNTSAGGGEKHVLDLSAGLVHAGDEVMIVALGGGDVLDKAAALGCETFEMKSFNPLSRTSQKALMSQVHEWRPDIIHAHGPRAAYFVRNQKMESAPPLVYTIHGIHAGHGTLGAVKTAVERRDKNLVAAFIVTCEADLIQGSQMGILVPEKTTVIYNGVPEPQSVEQGTFRRTLDIEEDRLLILHVGRISAPKDHPTLLAGFDYAWGKAASDNKPVLVLVATGSSADRKRLQRKIDHLESRNDIFPLPAQGDLASAYTDADIFALSSLWEARPYVLVEAMQYGCTVVSTKVGGVGEVIQDAKTGILVPSRDSQQLGEALYQLLVDEEMRLKLAEAGQNSMKERFSLDDMTSQTIALYRKVLEGPAV